MKYFLSFLCVAIIAAILIFSGTSNKQEKINPEDYLRIHIRANSNSEEDQTVKYKVKDEIVEALIPILSQAQSKDQVKKLLKANFGYIENVANSVLKVNGFNYSSKAVITREYFPTRVYENITLEEGTYDALILNLGSGSGDNWWCVVYPAFCFLQTKKSDNIVYISRIWDIIKSVLGI